MIAIQYDLPLVRDEGGSVSAFDTVWLRSTLSSAAAKAGYQGWWLVDDLAEGIATYLRHGYATRVIDLPKLESVVQTVLHAVGYDEVAARYQTVTTCHQISLLDCLRKLKPSDHDKFFDHLNERIAELNATKPGHVHFSDLQACLTSLAKCRPTTLPADDTSLLQQVVTFIRHRVQALPWRSRLRCSIS